MIENSDFLDDKYKRAVESLSRLTDVAIMAQHPSEVFVNLFRQHFLNGSRWLSNSNGISRSNWTYHSACSMMLTCRDMDYRIAFELQGRHDACIMTSMGEIIIYGEWEWNCNDIFGNGKELEKLVRSVESNDGSNAFLLTYIDEDNYELFLLNIFEYWSKHTDAILYLMTPVIRKSEDGSQILSLRVIDLQKDGVVCWTD